MIRVRQIKVPISDDVVLKYVSKKLRIGINEILSFKINKKSIDARRKNDIHYVYEIDMDVRDEKKLLKFNDVIKTPKEVYEFKASGKQKLKNRPVIVGSGPAGLFCAYMLAHYGYKPIVIERGEKVEDRVKTVLEFWKSGKLNKNSNVQFGEGGAGTFSDGKLNTLVKDKNFRMKKVFEIFVKHGAPKEIMFLNKPHIGTDKLRTIIPNMRDEIIKMGGAIRYNACLTDVVLDNNKVKQIVLNGTETVDCDVLVLAIGHSSRDTFEMLYEKKLMMEPKNFAVGIRIQNLQKTINESQYGKCDLPPANYKLTYKTKEGRGVYTFCMCPGGYVVNSSSEEGKLVINGMSDYNRDSDNANSAIIV
ncbi:MAG: FAD-dependent oxidoreductase, partial [Bacilli bacterium]|nr:FAD-dependent oxidoreductase [Bacilli bacterium]